MASSNTHRDLRVGSVPYLVGRPLDLGLELEPGIRYERRVPARLVDGLRSGELDVALVSSIELFRQPGYRFLDGVAVSGAGFVGSVQVFLRKPIEAVRTLALDPSSRAAATLVRVLLAKQAVEFVEVAEGADPRASACDAWLRIGDAALREHHETAAPPVFNPSEEWARRTGLPFVFAVWIARADAPLDGRLEAFARARERGRTAVEALADEASRAWHLPRAACRRYLGEECLYEPGAALAPALLAFRDAAAELGLCRADLAPEGIELPLRPCHVA
ncbi:MAG: menaquinone biosynthesis protein [Planctomycetes bacterium]|nr:menaquinone biosynthesis protein [Planctomycetota bacterium]